MSRWIPESIRNVADAAGVDFPTEHEEEDEEEEPDEEQDDAPVDVGLNLNYGDYQVASYGNDEEEEANGDDEDPNIAVDINYDRNSNNNEQRTSNNTTFKLPSFPSKKKPPPTSQQQPSSSNAATGNNSSTNSRPPTNNTNTQQQQQQQKKSPVQVSVNLPAGITASADVPHISTCFDTPRKRRIAYILLAVLVVGVALIATASAVASKNKKSKTSTSPEGGNRGIPPATFVAPSPPSGTTPTNDNNNNNKIPSDGGSTTTTSAPTMVTGTTDAPTPSLSSTTPAPTAATTTLTPTIAATTGTPTVSPTIAVTTLTPTLSPTLPRYTVEDVDQIVQYINNKTLSGQTLRYPLDNITDSSREELALEWLIEDRSVFFNVTLPADQIWMTERYALATFYWHHYDVANQEIPWFFSSGWLGFGSEVLNDWNECNWYGITCAELDLGGTIGTYAAVTSVSLPSNGLNGILPPDIGLLSHIREFNVGGNVDIGLGPVGVTGTLPTTIGLWTAMETFDVSQNSELVGTIPLSIQKWTNLQSMQLSMTGLAGTMPPGVCLSLYDVLPCAVECSCCESPLCY